MRIVQKLGNPRSLPATGKHLAQAITALIVLGVPNLSAVAKEELPSDAGGEIEQLSASVDFPKITPTEVIENGAEFGIEQITEVPAANQIAKVDSGADDEVPETAALTVGEGGRWGPVESWPVLAVHAALMPNGKVLAWDATPDDFDTDPHTRGTSSTRVTFWDPNSNTHQSVNNTTQYDLFCAGSAHLPNGSLLFSGGDSGAGGGNGPDSGSSSFNPFNSAWSREGNLGVRRWYSSMAAMPSGEMLTWGGSFLSATSPFGEVYSASDGSWRPLSGTRPSYGIGGDYQWVQSSPNGKMVHLGPSSKMAFIDTKNNLFDGGKTRDAHFRGYGSYAIYTAGKALVSGGAGSTRDSVVVDLNTLSTQSTGSLNIGRRQHNLTILADGSVLATGGNNTGSGLVDMNGAVHEAERWDPDTGQWSLLSRMSKNRQYHSVALLLPDGRVLSAGGGYCGTCTAVGYLEQNAEVFSPPYLFNANGSAAARPSINSAPSAVSYGIPFQMTVAASQVSKLHLIKLGSTTHSANQDQRVVPLNYQTSGNGTLNLTVEGPSNRNIAPPGHYMLIAVDNAGVPSVAKMVKVGGTEINFASSGTASQSSNSSGGVPARAIDGNTNGVWAGSSVTHTANQNQPWWQVDLGQVRPIEHIQLFNRTDCCSGRLNDVYVFVSETPFTASTVAATQSQTGVKTIRHSGTVGAELELPIAALGRYIRVQLGGTGFLSLAEVKALGSASTNLALGAPATQSSTYQSMSAASRAVDGDTMGNHALAPIAITKLTAQPWWQTDLGASTRIGEVVIHNRRDCCSDRLSNFYILTSEQPITGSLAANLANAAVQSTYHPGSFNGSKRFAIDQLARYVRVQLNGSNYLSLTEVEIFAKLGTNTTGTGETRQLTSGQAVGGNAAQGAWTYYTIDASAAHQQLVVDLTGLQADVDLYVRADQKPSGHVDEGGTYDCGSTVGGDSSERCTLNNTKATRWYIGVYGYNASAYNLKATLEEGTTGTGDKTLALGSSASGNVAIGQWAHYKVSVPANISEIQVDLTGLGADADLYVRRGLKPSGSQGEGGKYDCGSIAGGNTSERCVLLNSGANDYYLSVYGYNGSAYKLAVLGRSAASITATQITSDVAKTGSVSLKNWKFFKIDTGAEIQRLNVQLDQLNADADLYVRKGSMPSGDPASGANSDCISWVGGTDAESCEMANIGAGTWYIGVYGYQASRFRLLVSSHNNTSRSLSKKQLIGKGEDAKAASQQADEVTIGGGSNGLFFPLIVLLALRVRRR